MHYNFYLIEKRRISPRVKCLLKRRAGTRSVLHLRQSISILLIVTIYITTIQVIQVINFSSSSIIVNHNYFHFSGYQGRYFARLHRVFWSTVMSTKMQPNVNTRDQKRVFISINLSDLTFCHRLRLLSQNPSFSSHFPKTFSTPLRRNFHSDSSEYVIKWRLRNERNIRLH